MILCYNGLRRFILHKLLTNCRGECNFAWVGMVRREMRRHPAQTGTFSSVCQWSDGRMTGAFAQAPCPPFLCECGLSGTTWGNEQSGCTVATTFDNDIW